MIAIIGGGISGLAAAYELARRNRPFTLFEATGRLGGLVRTEQDGGFTIEAGADSMLVQKRAAFELCEELGLVPHLLSVKVPRTAFVLHAGTLYPLPHGSLLGIPSTWGSLASYALLPPLARARVALEPLIRAAPAATDESLDDFVSRRFGSVFARRVAQPLLGGIHAGDVRQLSVRSLFPKLVEAERSDGVLRWARRTARARSAEGAFRSLPGGMSDLVTAIQRRLPADSIRCAHPVQSIEHHDGAWRISTAADATTARAVILACPAYVAGSLLAPIAPDAAALCQTVPYVSTVSVALAWTRAAVAHPLAGSGFVVARAASDTRITACTWVSSKWDHRAPAGQVLLRGYLGGEHDPAVVDMTDEEIITVVVRELSAILSITGAPLLARVSRWPRRGAQHTVGHLARIGELERALSRHQGVFVTGSGFRSIGIPDCIADGRAVAIEAGTFAYGH